MSDQGPTQEYTPPEGYATDADLEETPPTFAHIADDLEWLVSSESSLNHADHLGDFYALYALYDIVTVLRSDTGEDVDKSEVVDKLPFTKAELTWMDQLQVDEGIRLLSFDREMASRASLDMVARFRTWLISDPEGPYEGQARALIAILREATSPGHPRSANRL